ncbi:MAG TPA: single-stranded-DNA-specific exonuclease RecJ [Virgibacillus sp.]|nr:single-stranded-DNA-specific exonuclease RecJ [Virgibacillus sp.]
MLASKAKWNVLHDENKPSLEDLEAGKDLSSITKELLVQRNIVTEEAVNDFLFPDMSRLHSPHHLTMIEKASKRVHEAISKEEKILVYGDYDADGVSSTALLMKTLIELGAHCDFYIPNRFTEGYGPNEAAFRLAAENDVHVIITVDTGIASIHEALIAKELGIDLIITDHHELQDELPDAYAIINPKCSPEYAFHELAGVGVALKFSEILLGYFPEHLLDLVAIGTIADLVPLIDENRILAHFGLQQLTTTKNMGLRALKKVCGITDDLIEDDVGFAIGPRLNAVGRLQDARLAVELLLTESQEEAEEITDRVESINQERQQIVNEIIHEAEAMVSVEDEESVIIVAKQDWNEGVLGIVASRLVRKYDRPAIVLRIKEETGEVKGSARSIPAFNFFESCMKVKSLFTRFGGHSQAAGMTLPIENIGDLQAELNKIIKAELTADDFKPAIEVNKKLSIADINEDLINQIGRLAPFGMSNPKPIFHIQDIPTETRQIGNLKNHLKLQFKVDDAELEGIGFSMGHLFPHITPHTPVEIVGELGINEWNGVRKPQIIMRDMKIAEWQLFDHRGKRNIDMSPFTTITTNQIIIREQNPEEINEFGEHIKQITYDTDITTLEETESLFIYDLPTNLTLLQEIIKATNPLNIHVCFYVENSTYLTAFPTRDEFKWFYGLVYRRKKLDLNKELNAIMSEKKWTKETVVFIAKVFLELEFVKIENGVIQMAPDPVKRDLQESAVYQARIKQGDIEKKLYYSNYESLKSWFAKCKGITDNPREEEVYGL